jgi:hypothetical protein
MPMEDLPPGDCHRRQRRGDLDLDRLAVPTVALDSLISQE